MDSGESCAIELLEQRYDAETCPAARPVFAAPKGGLRDPSNTQADLRAAFHDCGNAWVTSHVFRGTVASLMDDAGKTARAVADQLGHSQPSMSQDKYMGRRGTSDAADVLEVLGGTLTYRNAVALGGGVENELVVGGWWPECFQEDCLFVRMSPARQGGPFADVPVPGPAVHYALRPGSKGSAGLSHPCPCQVQFIGSI